MRSTGDTLVRALVVVGCVVLGVALRRSSRVSAERAREEGEMVLEGGEWSGASPGRLQTRYGRRGGTRQAGVWRRRRHAERAAASLPREEDKGGVQLGWAGWASPGRQVTFSIFLSV